VCFLTSRAAGRGSTVALDERVRPGICFAAKGTAAMPRTPLRFPPALPSFMAARVTTDLRQAHNQEHGGFWLCGSLQVPQMLSSVVAGCRTMTVGCM
jgi:hypothetical protein